MTKLIMTSLVDVWEIIEANKRTMPEGLLSTFYSSYYVSFRLFHFSDFINHSKTTGIDIVHSLFACYLAGKYDVMRREVKFADADELLEYDKAFYDELWYIFCEHFLGTTDKIKPYQVPSIEVLKAKQCTQAELHKRIQTIFNNLLISLVIDGAEFESIDELYHEIEKYVHPHYGLETGPVKRTIYYAFGLLKMHFMGIFLCDNTSHVLNAGLEIIELYFAKASCNLEKRRYHRSLYNGLNSEHYTNFLELPLTFKS